MVSIHNIPEPTTAYRPVDHEPAAPAVAVESLQRADCVPKPDTTVPNDEIDAQNGALTWLIVLVLCGIVLRLVLLYFGSLHTAQEAGAAWVDHGAQLFQSGPAALEGTPPLYPVLAWTLHAVGIPLWALALLQSGLGIVSIIAAYHVGLKLTGRRAAALAAAALVSLHPAVLTGAAQLHPGGLAAPLVFIALYLAACWRPNDPSPARALASGAVLLFAALTAPAAWLAGLGVVWLFPAQNTGYRRITRCLTVLLLAAVPALAWAQLSAGTPAAAWGLAGPAGWQPPTAASLVGHSLREQGALLRIQANPNGTLTRLIEGQATLSAEHDLVIDLAGDLWIATNVLLWAGALLSVGLMLARRRAAAAACCAAPLLLLLTAGLGPTETSRLVLFGPLALLAVGWLSTDNAPSLTDEERAALAYEKDLVNQAKQQAKRAKHEQKHGLYAFDTPQAKPRETPPLEALQGPEEDPPPVMRPI